MPVVNVMPEFPPQSPDNPVIAERFQLPAPAPVISLMSKYVHDTDAADIVLPVPSTSLRINRRLIALLPLAANAVVTVWVALILKLQLKTALAVRVKFA